MAQPELLTSEQLAHRLQVKPETVRAWGRDGRIPRICMSAKVIRYDPVAVIKSLKERLPRLAARDGGDG